MAKLLGRGKWASDLARAVGEDPGKVTRITIDCAADGVVTVLVEKYVEQEDGQRIYELLTKHAWVEDDKEENA